MERTEVVAAHDGVFGGFGLFDRDVVGDEEESVKLMVDVIDALEEEFGELDGRDLSRFDEIEQVGGGSVCEVLVGHDVGVKGFAGCGFRLR